MKKPNNIIISLLVCLVSASSFSQNTTVEDALLWEVSGKDLKESSFLFGTFHLLDNRFADSLTVVMDKLDQSKTVTVEMITDSTMSIQLLQVVQLKGTSLDKLLSAEDYQNTSTWFKELTGYDLSFFNTVNPLTIQLFIMASLQQKYYPMNPLTDIPMDSYFQKIAKKQNKKIVGLETFEEQIRVLYGQFSNERQAELLAEYTRDKEKANLEVARMNHDYRQQKLGQLAELMATQQYDKKEAEVILDNRNKKWMEILPGLMKEQSTFVAVGALHLVGDNGLVTLLRKQGYTVKPLPVK
jgi:uncharacterized protein